MKIIKPLRLGILHRPWRWQGKNRLGVSLLALADMGPAPRLRPEPELWQLAAQELTGSGGLLDLAIPKACAEFLATGYAYTRHQPQKNACLVKIRVGKREKSLVAFGDRYWVNGQPSPALPFERLRLDWEHAFGGENDALNPRGMGAAPVIRDGAPCHPLANIELPGQGYTPARRTITPAGFGPLDFAAPANFKRLGQRHDQQWLERDYPGFARDIDWHVFNRAASDQWWPQAAALPAGAPWQIWNMHPHQPLQQGTLPAWQARCFIQRAGKTALEEVALRATTLWFFPHLEQMVLIWQGSCTIAQDDALDVEQLLAAIELPAQRRSTAFYQQVLHLRGQKATGAAYALRERDLVAESLIGPWLDTAPRPAESPLAAHLAAREKRLRARHRETLSPAGRAGDGSTAGTPLTASPALDDLPDFMARLDRQAADLQRQAQDKAPAMTAAAAGPASYYRMMDALRQPGTPSSRPAPDMGSKDAQRGLHEIYRLSADTRPAASPLGAEQTAAIRRHVLDGMAHSRDFSGLDLTGADLSGMDLRQANFHQALLESARLDNCLLDGANLNEAMLAHASLADASLHGAQLIDTCLTGARCRNSRFTAARLTGVLVQQATLDNCRFDQAQLSGLLFYHTAVNRCRFSHATLENCVFLEPDMADLDFDRCRLEKTTFLQGKLCGARFNHARLANCSFVTMALDGIRFAESRLDDCVFTSGTHALRSIFRGARLSGCNFRQTPLNGADFSRALARNSDFSAAVLCDAVMGDINAGGCLFIRTDLTRASLPNANLMGALLQKCRLAGADLSHANLFRADLSQSSIDAQTRLGDAYIVQCKTLPRAGEPVS